VLCCAAEQKTACEMKISQTVQSLATSLFAAEYEQNIKYIAKNHTGLFMQYE